MKPFDTKIDRLDGWNRHLQQRSLSTPESGEPISLPQKKKKTENEVNEIWYRNWILKN
jgi:hypothetical protein